MFHSPAATAATRSRVVRRSRRPAVVLSILTLVAAALVGVQPTSA